MKHPAPLPTEPDTARQASAPARGPRPPGAPTRALLTAAALVGALAAGGAIGQTANDAAAWDALRAADIDHGRRLITQHQCSACHARRVGGDGSAIYRPAGRINRPAALLAMVEMCNTELNLQLFPEDVAAVAAVLNQAHYRFNPPAARP